jgi:hypothetical protein
MSILNALKQQDGSIDELARLPQTMIMQMAQRKEINAEMVAPILARKAQMADAVARTKALQKGGAQMPSIMEQLMQKTADQENPEPEPQAREMGVAQLPVREDMYTGEGMAAGGIVAFAKAGEVEDPSVPPQQEGETDNAYMNRVRAVQEAGSQFFTPRNYDPIAKLGDLYTEYVGNPFARGVKSFVNETPEEQAAKFRSYSQQPKTEAGAVKLAPKAPDAQYEEQGRNAYVSTPAKPGITSLIEKPSDKTKVQSPLQKATNAPETQGAEPAANSIDALIASLTKKAEGDPEASAKAKKEAMWNRLLEAGLNVMGGQSTNFAQNMALAGPAAKGYGEDVKGIRAEEAAKIQQLMGLGLKGAALKQEAQKLGITAKHFDQMYNVQMAQNQIMAGTRADTNAQRAETATEGRITAYAGKLLALPKYMDNPELAYADAKKAVTGQSAQPTFTGFSGRSLK